MLRCSWYMSSARSTTLSSGEHSQRLLAALRASTQPTHISKTLTTLRRRQRRPTKSIAPRPDAEVANRSCVIFNRDTAPPLFSPLLVVLTPVHLADSQPHCLLPRSSVGISARYVVSSIARAFSVWYSGQMVVLTSGLICRTSIK